MVLIIVFLTALALLYILTKQILKTITAFAHHVTRSTHIAVAFLSLLLYPGTIVHEMAHLITALILLVPIKGLKLEPVVKHGYIRAGSVATQHTDWLRQIFISIAPLPFGITILWLLSQRAFPDLIDASQQFFKTIV
jgi:hypothetical protein